MLGSPPPQAAPAASSAAAAVPLPAPAQAVAAQFSGLADPKERYRLLLSFAKQLPVLPESERRPENRVMGCTAQAWVAASLTAQGVVSFAAASDSELTAGLAAVLVQALSGLTPQQVGG